MPLSSTTLKMREVALRWLMSATCKGRQFLRPPSFDGILLRDENGVYANGATRSLREAGFP